MVFSPFCQQEDDGDEGGEDLGGGDGVPDAVDAEEQGQEDDGGRLEHQRAQKRNRRGDQPVAERSKERRGKNVESRKQKCKGKQPERMARQREQSLVVPDKDLRQRRGQYPREYRQHDAGGAHQDDAHAQHVFEFRVVPRAVVEADDRRAADGIADIDGNEDKLDVHQNAVGRYAVLAEVFEQLEVIDHADDGGRDIAHQLGRAVAAGVQDRPQLQLRPDEAELARVRAQEIEQREQPADALAQARGDGRARDAPVENRDEQRIEHHIRHARRDRRGQTELRLLRHDQKALEHVLQHKRARERDDDPAVEHAVGQHLRRCAEKQRHRPHKHNAHRRQHRADQHGKEDHHGKIAFGLLLVALAEDLGHERRAARADHEADAAEHHNERHDQIDGRERGLTGIIGDEQPVHHAVDRGEDHHDDGREDKLQQLPVGKMVGKLDGSFHRFFSRRQGAALLFRYSLISAQTARGSGRSGGSARRAPRPSWPRAPRPPPPGRGRRAP